MTVKHNRLSAQYHNCRLGNEAIHQPLTKGGTRELAKSVRDPELEAIVAQCARHTDGAKAGKPLPADQQPKAWLKLRDAYAAKNYSLVYRAAERQWRANQHLPGEQVKCVYCPGPPTCKHPLKDGRCSVCLSGCNRCKNTGFYVCQPDLEALAYAGLLEAIRLCDFEKGGDKISTYAVWLMKQAMMPLLRQTPVFFPQELLRDRRVLCQLKKTLKCDTCRGVKAKKLQPECATCAGTGKRNYTRAEAEAALLAIRKCKQTESIDERILLAEGCYYGQEKSSIEELQEAYVQHRPNSRQMKSSHAKLVIEALSVSAELGTDDIEDDALRQAVAKLPITERKLAEAWLRGRSADLSPSVIAALQEEML